MTIFEKLLTIQAALKVPKSQYNAFSKFSYRNCEDILEAVKPLCVSCKASLIITDELVSIGDRYYVKATAMLVDIESAGAPIVVTAYAREEDKRSGMDAPQLTGASSSYARKYALNGLFCIDDTKDPDYYNGNPAAQDPSKPATKTKAPAAAEKPAQSSTATAGDICPVCSGKVQPAMSQKQGRVLSGAEIIAGYGNMCGACYQKSKTV